MEKMIDITNLSNAALEAILLSKTNTYVDAEKLTSNDRYDIAKVLGWEMTPYVRNWIFGPSTPCSNDKNDYEGAILARQEKYSEY